MNNLVKIKVFYSTAEAELAKGYLQANNINAFIVADDEHGRDPFFTSVTASGVHLFVANKDSKIAMILLDKVK